MTVHDSTGVPLNIIECYLTNWRLRWLSGSPLCGIELCADVEAIEEGRKVWQISLHSHDLTSHNKCEGPEVMTHSQSSWLLLYFILCRCYGIVENNATSLSMSFITNMLQSSTSQTKCASTRMLYFSCCIFSFSTVLHTSLASVWTWWLCTRSAQESIVRSLYKRIQDASWSSAWSGVLWLPCAIWHPTKS